MQYNNLNSLILYTCWTIFALTAFGTLAMLFFGFGAVQDEERSILIGAFLVESAVMIFAFVKNNQKMENKNSASLAEELEENKNIVSQQKLTIEELKLQLDEKTNHVWEYKGAILSFCSPLKYISTPELLKRLGFEQNGFSKEKAKVLNEIGQLKELGVLVHDSMLDKDSFRLKK
ncbi:hypothetical protein [Vibrio mediterranei]|uniref:hypothetical protein n=1 Tax=Vibrio mediterranei TaxID=689 RepID=UPI004068AD6B